MIVLKNLWLKKLERKKLVFATKLQRPIEMEFQEV